MSNQVTIGLDVGGTKVAGVRLEGMQVTATAELPTSKESGEALLEQMAQVAEQLGCDSADGVGAGVPSAVDYAEGFVIASVNVPLNNFPVRDQLSDRLELPVAIDNDANVAALAEAVRDDGSAVGSLVMFTLGTGVGGGIVIGGKVFRGATGGAGHLGHELVAAAADGERVDEGFPRHDSLEALAAGPALDALAVEAGHAAGPALVDAAKAGDSVAIEVIERYAGRLALGVANMIHTFDPDEVVIGGGVSAAGGLLLEPLMAAVKPLILPGIGTRTEVRLARHGGQAGAIGAALLVRDTSA